MKISTIRRAIATAAIVAGIAAATALTAPAASAAAVVGGVDMQRACNTQYPPSFGLRAVVLDQRNAYSWRCAAPWDSTRGIDVNRACANQYGSGAWSGPRDSRNPYSRYCQR